MKQNEKACSLSGLFNIQKFAQKYEFKVEDKHNQNSDIFWLYQIAIRCLCLEYLDKKKNAVEIEKIEKSKVEQYLNYIIEYGFVPLNICKNDTYLNQVLFGFNSFNSSDGGISSLSVPETYVIYEKIREILLCYESISKEEPDRDCPVDFFLQKEFLNLKKQHNFHASIVYNLMMLLFSRGHIVINLDLCDEELVEDFRKFLPLYRKEMILDDWKFPKKDLFAVNWYEKLTYYKIIQYTDMELISSCNCEKIKLEDYVTFYAQYDEYEKFTKDTVRRNIRNCQKKYISFKFVRALSAHVQRTRYQIEETSS